MNIATNLLDEFEHELATTRRFLDRVPEQKLQWRPHEKSMTAGQLALHIAQTPAGVLKLALDDNPSLPNTSDREQPRALREVLATLEESAAYVRETLPGLSDARLGETWKIVQAGREIVSMPRGALLRSIMLNHWYHHRGQLGVYLRLMGAKVPVSYGPSGDESPF